MTSTRALVRGIRPRQWSKNILVLAAPVAAGIAFQPRVVVEMGVAVLAFILASSGVYLVNDAVDVEADRAHPTKRLRPVAAGELSAREASIAALVLLAGGLAVSALLGWQLFAVVVLYETVQILYCLGMQNVPVVELLSVASGFLLRAIAGGVATGVELSPWFLVAVGFGSLFVAAGKRYSELQLAEDATAAIRPVLARYADGPVEVLAALPAARAERFPQGRRIDVVLRRLHGAGRHLRLEGFQRWPGQGVDAPRLQIAARRRALGRLEDFPHDGRRRRIGLESAYRHPPLDGLADVHGALPRGDGGLTLGASPTQP